jgi:hypothetical protein
MDAQFSSGNDGARKPTSKGANVPTLDRRRRTGILRRSPRHRLRMKSLKCLITLLHHRCLIDINLRSHHVLGDLHRAEFRPARGAEVRHFVRVLGQRLVVVSERGVGGERQVELVDPAEVEAGAAQRVEWLERSETRQIRVGRRWVSQRLNPSNRAHHQVSCPGLQGGPDGRQAVLQDGPPDGGQ